MDRVQLLKMEFFQSFWLKISWLLICTWGTYLKMTNSCFWKFTNRPEPTILGHIIFQNFFKFSPILMKFFLWISFMKRSAWLNFCTNWTKIGKKWCLKFVRARFMNLKKTNPIQILLLFFKNGSQNTARFDWSISTIWHTVFRIGSGNKNTRIQLENEVVIFRCCALSDFNQENQKFHLGIPYYLITDNNAAKLCDLLQIFVK